MGVYEGRGQLAKATKELLSRWAETKGDWDDAVSQNFEKRFLVMLEMDIRAATSAMDTMAQVLAAVRRDCSDDAGE
jgi:predicted secreted Zn-dependent protease